MQRSFLGEFDDSVLPRRVDQFQECLLPDHLPKDVQGDLHEVFYKRVEETGKAKGKMRISLLPNIRYVLASFNAATSLHHTQNLSI